MSGQDTAPSARQDTLDRGLHSVREPLAAISGFAQVLAHRHAADASVVELAGRITEGVSVIDRVVGELLRYIALDDRVINAEPLATAEIVEDVLDRSAGAIERTGASVDVGPLEAVIGDREAVFDLIEALVTLAVGPGTRVTIGCRRERDICRFTVASDRAMADDYPGSDPFAPFGRRAAPGQWSSDLAICRRLAELQGGRIWIEPESGASSISFTLPAP